MRRMRLHKIAFTLVVSMFVAAPLCAQAPVVASSDPESLFTSRDPKLNTNKQAAMHIMRDLLEGGHWADAPMWLTPEYIQHNPNIVSGRESVMKFFGARPPGQIPARNAWRTKVVSVTAEGDDVVVSVLREMDNPRKPGEKYTTTWFDMWRFKDGKANEHWDYGTIAPPPAAGAAPGRQ
jgi:predicted SnoaL-like aldol condensation-catalyzing enzyme